MKNKLKSIIKIIISITIILSLYGAWENTALELNTFIIESERIPNRFDGYRIAHISDLHNTEMGENNEKLISLLKELKPDMIAITGDLIDSRNTDIEVALEFVSEAIKIAPCYYVTGNHEARVSEYTELKDGLFELGVNVLEDKKIEIERLNESIILLGINDPSFDTDYLFGDDETIVSTKLENLMNGEDKYTILLSHRPELFDIYVENNIDLVLSGHAHGGQFRLPFIGGIVAPNQGLFPKYDSGLYNANNTHLIVSRGIGNSIIPLRLNNRPEVIMIELNKI